MKPKVEVELRLYSHHLGKNRHDVIILSWVV